MDTGTRAVLEHIACAVCGGNDYDVVYEAENRPERDDDLVHRFRASGDELLTDFERAGHDVSPVKWSAGIVATRAFPASIGSNI